MILSAGLCANGIFPPAVNLTIPIGNISSYNVYDAARLAGWDGVRPVVINVVVNSGNSIGSDNITKPAIEIPNTIPLSSTVNLTISGLVAGKGGNGAPLSSSNSTGVNGENGGNAISVARPVIIQNFGAIFGGGGGGASSKRRAAIVTLQGGGGGGGAGTNPGIAQSTGSYAGQNGSTGLGGEGGNPQCGFGICADRGGYGGDLGQAGEGTSSSTGGLPGYAIYGIGYVIFGNQGTVVGR